MKTKLIIVTASLLVSGFGSNLSAHEAKGDNYKKNYVSHAELEKELEAFYNTKKAEEEAAAQKAREEVQKQWTPSPRTFGHSSL